MNTQNNWNIHQWAAWKIKLSENSTIHLSKNTTINLTYTPPPSHFLVKRTGIKDDHLQWTEIRPLQEVLNTKKFY